MPHIFRGEGEGISVVLNLLAILRFPGTDNGDRASKIDRPMDDGGGKKAPEHPLGFVSLLSFARERSAVLSLPPWGRHKGGWVHCIHSRKPERPILSSKW